ncbi:hypothetical protein [Shewanella algae]|uniref:hypothetical protein n=1 Tax=Shewanella algae TaxID=38313 RepID=UPI0031F4AD7F
MNTIKPTPVVRDDYGYWTHPDLPVWDEGTTREQIDAWAKENNGTIVVEWMDGDAPEEVADRYFEVGEADCSYWYPHCSKAGNFLLSIHDTEDGPIAMFFVPTPSQAELDAIAELDSKFNELAKAASDLVAASSKLSNASNAEEAEVATEVMAESQARIDAIVKAKEAA